MRSVEYGNNNRAHQLTQGRKKGSSPPCAMIGRGCQQKDTARSKNTARSKTTATSLAYTMEGKHVYMCSRCKSSWTSAYANHSHEGLQETVDYFINMIEYRHGTDRNLPLDEEGPCECCGDEEFFIRAFLNGSSLVTCSRCPRRWRDWSGECDRAVSVTKDMSNVECEAIWQEFVSGTVEWIAKVGASKAKREKGSCIACPATAETTTMRSLPEDFFPDEVDDEDVLCPQCLTQFSANRTRKIYY